MQVNSLSKVGYPYGLATCAMGEDPIIQMETDLCSNFYDLESDTDMSEMRKTFQGRNLTFVNCLDSEGETPLLKAAIVGNLALVEFLLNHKADVNFFRDNEHNPLYWACVFMDLDKGRYLPIVELLLEWGADLSKISNEHFFKALKVKDDGIYRIFLRYGAGNIPDSKGSTELHKAAKNGNLTRVDWILERLFKSDVILSSSFSKSMLEGCSTPTQISQLEQIPVEQLTDLRTYVQNYCNTYIRKKDGSMMVLAHTNAKNASDFVLARLKEIHKMILPARNTLTINMFPHHVSVGLDCFSCAEGKPYRKMFGAGGLFLPLPFFLASGRGVIQDEDRWDSSDLKLSIPIDDVQANAVWNKKQSMDASYYIYDMYLANCVNVAEDMFRAAGNQNFFGFFAPDQIQFHPRDILTSLAILYGKLEYGYKIPFDLALFTSSFTSAFVAYKITRSFFSLLSKPALHTPKEESSNRAVSSAVGLGLAHIAARVSARVTQFLVGGGCIVGQVAGITGFLYPAVVLGYFIKNAPDTNPQSSSLFNKQVSLIENLNLVVLSGQIASFFIGVTVKDIGKVMNLNALSYLLITGAVTLNEMRKILQWHPPSINNQLHLPSINNIYIA